MEHFKERLESFKISNAEFEISRLRRIKEEKRNSKRIKEVNRVTNNFLSGLNDLTEAPKTAQSKATQPDGKREGAKFNSRSPAYDSGNGTKTKVLN